MLALPNPSGTPRPVRVHECKVHVVLLGGNYVGKSWLLHRYLFGPIEKLIEATIGVDFHVKTEHLDHGKNVRFIISDTTGQEKFDSLSEASCIRSHAAIVVYDITDERSFEKAKFWVKRLKEVASPDIFKALAANKADLVSKRMVTYEDAQSYADDNGVDLFMEVSSLTGENVDNLFLTVGYNLEMANISTAQLRKTIVKDSKALDLGRRRLVRVVDTVTELTEVKVLNLSHNELSKLPTSTSKMTNLTTLNLNHNKLAHFPEIVVELINLTHLFVNNNQLFSLPTSLKKLEKLQKLDLRKNRLKRICKDISDLKYLEKLYVEGNPLKLQEITSLLQLVNEKQERISIDNAVPTEILAQGDVAKLLYEEALREGSVNVYRGRISFIGQARAGKTSLKKSLIGLPFNPKEQSTVGIEVDPSICEIEVEQVKNWNSTGANRPSLSEFSKEISKILAEKQYNRILREAKEDLEMESEGELCGEASKVKSTVDPDTKDKKSSLTNQISENEENLKKTDISTVASEIRVQAEENNTVDRLTENGSTSSSKESELIIDTTSPPDDVTVYANHWLKNMLREGLDAESGDNKEESVVTVDLWDFAGQHLYYASHPVFLSSRAVYVLVHNLSKPLNAPAQPCVRQGTHDVILENPNSETNLENLLSWLGTVHSITPAGEGMVDNSDRMLPYRQPPVFIVGTHADKPFEDAGIMTSKIQKEISGKEFEKHVIRPFFSIDNTHQGNLSVFRRIKKLFGREVRSDTDIAGDGIHALRDRIMEVLRQEPYMEEKIPVRWFNFEKVVEALVAKNIYHMNLEQLQTYAKEVCFIGDEDQFHAMLNFYHDLGMIVKHHSTVILKAQWLIDLFKKLITIPPFDKVDPVQSKYWQEVERSGVLSMELVDHVFSKFIQEGLVKEDILGMMERFGLIAKFSPASSDVKYFVPAQLKSSPEDLGKMEPSPTDPCPLYLHFMDGFVPHGLFSQFVSRSISWCSEIGSTQPPNLYRNGAWFVVGRQIIHDMILICKKKFIKISLKQRSQEEAVSVTTSPDEARSVRLFVESTLQDLSQELPYLRGLRYEFCVACPYCLQGSHECVNHGQLSCKHEDCLHLLEIKEDERLICMKSVCDKVLAVRGLEKWFSPRASQDVSPTDFGASESKATHGNPGRTDTALKVTLLASEWSSSMGGLSTINRQLAILLAEHIQVEVTLLLPQFACCEEEKRAARSHGVVIREAERRPGYDPLEWLSFPPRDLAIDIVLGHGGKLGKQAQVIRESHNCNWVQVVHTAPEELGMHKNYPQAISRGEEKNRTEVDLCKMADLVVAVGPKLTEAYSSHLRSCKEHQDIIQLTPGTFSEFSVTKQATYESEKFKVLTFGRGDPEDFSLKGYDIAANAIAEMKDSSYRLIFVGAPDGKQEEVAENLLHSGISKDQLTVRKFVQSKERLIELFCEVDLAIMPSRTEGFGLTALEALSAGLPILVSGNSGFADALRALPSGKSFVVESANPKEWAKAITVVRLKDRAERLQEIQRLRACYEEHYSWKKQCNVLVQKMWSIVHG